jgi:hypothetical protein
MKWIPDWYNSHCIAKVSRCLFWTFRFRTGQEAIYHLSHLLITWIGCILSRGLGRSLVPG